MESLVLHHPSVVLELPHDQFQIISRIDIARHDLVKLAIQQDFSQQLDALALCNIALRSYQNVVVALEEHIKVGADVLRDQRLMLSEQQAKSIERVGADFERRLVDPAEEFPEHALAGGRLAGVDVGVYVDCLAVREWLVVQYHGGNGVPFESFLQDAAARTCALAAVITVAKSDDEFGLFPDDIAQSVGLRRRAVRAPKPENIRDDSLGILARFEGQAVNVVDEQRQESVGEDGRDKSKHLLRVGLCLRRALQSDLDCGDVLGQILLDLRFTRYSSVRCTYASSCSGARSPWESAHPGSAVSPASPWCS